MVFSYRAFKNTIKFNIKKTLYIYKKNNISEKDRRELRNKKKAFVFSTPQHGNLGDHAIAYAQKNFLKEEFPTYFYFEVPLESYFNQLKLIKDIINEKDLIFIHGGGNMGTLYPLNEMVRRDILNTFRNNYIFQFPQSVVFDESSWGKSELKKSLKSYNSNSNLTLLAREKTSLKFMQENFLNNEIELIPDIVFSLNLQNNKTRRGVFTSFRNDKERKISKEYRSSLIEEIKNHDIELTLGDTHLGDGLKITEKNRQKKLLDIWANFQTSEVVLTDRLHGMIFAYITSTPCIVFENNNPKIISTYNDWLKDCNFIKLVSDEMSVESIVDNIDDLKKLKPYQINLNSNFSFLKSIIKEKINV